MSASVCIGNVSHTFNFVIVEGATRALLGRDIWAKFGLTLNGVTVVFKGKEVSEQAGISLFKVGLENMLTNNPLLESMLSEYSNIFSNELGTYNGGLIRLETTENIQPIVTFNL